MDILEKVKMLKDKELDKFIEERINVLSEETKEKLVLGEDIGINPTPISLTDFSDTLNYEVPYRSTYHKFIPIGSKIVYGLFHDEEAGIVLNNGCYYYMDDCSYINEFCEFIKDKDIKNEIDFIWTVFYFITEYFGNIMLDERTREEYHQPILKDEYSYLEPITSHMFSEFKGLGKARCTEVAVLAQNVFRFFGLNSSIIVGEIKFSDEEEFSSHSYNIIPINVDDSDETINLLVDLSCTILLHDFCSEHISKMPFIGNTGRSFNDTIAALLDMENGIKFNNYCCMAFGENTLKINQDLKRIYTIKDGIIKEDKNILVKIKEK